ncbi:hypothetical protein [Paenibacillus turpanensis]|uniref:hypothetical protein n=1 Tax=Paenibacillus turpanensis TaxID=2689078 RepID=UPI00140E5E94|nr:hypothetical protein [Paenibacillus turpanensis]
MQKELRRQLRCTVLKEVYYTTRSRRSRKTIPVSIEFEDPETFFALEYLADKGLIYLRQQDQEHYVAKITSSGKQYVEQGKDIVAAY